MRECSKISDLTFYGPYWTGNTRLSFSRACQGRSGGDRM